MDWNKEINVMESLNSPELIYLSLRVTKYPRHKDNLFESGSNLVQRV